jgi:hypothetical protein
MATITKQEQQNAYMINEIVHKALNTTYKNNEQLMEQDTKLIKEQLVSLYDKYNLLQSMQQNDTMNTENTKSMQLLKQSIVYYELMVIMLQEEHSKQQHTVSDKYMM